MHTNGPSIVTQVSDSINDHHVFSNVSAHSTLDVFISCSTLSLEHKCEVKFYCLLVFPS